MAGKVRVKRDSQGRYAGSYGGGKGSTLVRSGGGNSRLVRQAGTNKSSKPVAKATKPVPAQRAPQKSGLSTKKKVLIGGAILGAGVGGKIAMGKVLPSTTFVKSGKSIAGLQNVVSTDALAKGVRVTSVNDGGLSYLTQSIPSGRGLSKKISTSTIVSRGNTSIGIIHSERYAHFSRTNIVKTSYLTPTNRKKGIGGKALTAHAAHDPRRRHRASITRSVQGQAFARSAGGAGLRSGKSKTAGDKLTREMNSMWTVNKGDYNAVARELRSVAGPKSSVITTRDINALRRPKKRLR